LAVVENDLCKWNPFKLEIKVMTHWKCKIEYHICYFKVPLDEWEVSGAFLNIVIDIVHHVFKWLAVKTFFSCSEESGCFTLVVDLRLENISGLEQNHREKAIIRITLFGLMKHLNMVCFFVSV